MNTTASLPERAPRRSGLVGPTILIGLGVVFLLNNLGMLGWEIWDVILPLWPLLLIAVGLDLLIGRRSLLGSLLVVVLLLGTLAVTIWYSGLWWTSAPAPAGEAIVQPLGGATRAEVDIKLDAGTLRIGALGESTDLIAGSIAHDPRERIVREFDVAGGTAKLKLRSEGRAVWSLPLGEQRGPRPLWDLRLNDRVPLRLSVSTGAGAASIDLARLQLESLSVSAGVGATTLTLPRQGVLSANVSGGVGQTTVVIPAGMAARVTATTGIGQVRVLGSFERQDKTYVSPGYAEAESRVDLTVSGGVGSITVQQESGR